LQQGQLGVAQCLDQSCLISIIGSGDAASQHRQSERNSEHHISSHHVDLLAYLRRIAHFATTYLTITHVGCSSGNAMRPTTAVTAISSGLFTFQRIRAAIDTAAMATSASLRGHSSWICGHEGGCADADWQCVWALEPADERQDHEEMKEIIRAP
jgi:hypothetical protein